MIWISSFLFFGILDLKIYFLVDTLKLLSPLQHHEVGSLLHAPDSCPHHQLRDLVELSLNLPLEGRDGGGWRRVHLLLQVPPASQTSPETSS